MIIASIIISTFAIVAGVTNIVLVARHNKRRHGTWF